MEIQLHLVALQSEKSMPDCHTHVQCGLIFIYLFICILIVQLLTKIFVCLFN